MPHNNSFGMAVVLDGKMVDLNAVRQFIRNTVVDHIDGGHIVCVKWSGTLLWVC